MSKNEENKAGKAWLISVECIFFISAPLLPSFWPVSPESTTTTVKIRYHRIDSCFQRNTLTIETVPG
jgi:hypothetical protein